MLQDLDFAMSVWSQFVSLYALLKNQATSLICLHTQVVTQHGKASLLVNRNPLYVQNINSILTTDLYSQQSGTFSPL